MGSRTDDSWWPARSPPCLELPSFLRSATGWLRALEGTLLLLRVGVMAGSSAELRPLPCACLCVESLWPLPRELCRRHSVSPTRACTTRPHTYMILSTVTPRGVPISERRKQSPPAQSLNSLAPQNCTPSHLDDSVVLIF